MVFVFWWMDPAPSEISSCLHPRTPPKDLKCCKKQCMETFCKNPYRVREMEDPWLIQSRNFHHFDISFRECHLPKKEKSSLFPLCDFDSPKDIRKTMSSMSLEEANQYLLGHLGKLQTNHFRVKARLGVSTDKDLIRGINLNQIWVFLLIKSC